MSVSRRQLLGVAPAMGLLTVASAPRVSAEDGPGWSGLKRKVAVGRLEMAWYEAGQGDPVVFLHGNPTSSYLWRNIIPHVTHLGRCIAPDLLGMGDSDPLEDSGPGAYTFRVHCDYLSDLLDAIGATERVTFVAHDWGSGIAFDWSRRHPDRVRGLAYSEMILRLADAPQAEPQSGLFALLRSEEGEHAVLQDNLFLEEIFLAPLRHYLTDADRAEYRRPFLEPGESRRPTLAWPRELPLGQRPQETIADVEAYTRWLGETDVPKLFFHALPGAIMANPALLEYVRGFRNQHEVTVYGPHYVQEVSPDAMGRALAEWLEALR